MWDDWKWKNLSNHQRILALRLFWVQKSNDVQSYSHSLMILTLTRLRLKIHSFTVLLTTFSPSMTSHLLLSTWQHLQCPRSDWILMHWYRFHNVPISVVEPGKPAWKKIKAEFGDSVFHDDGTINREALGKLIFDDVEKRRFLNSITHPEIHRRIYLDVIKCFIAGHNFVVVDLPLLFETGVMIQYCHKIITVTWYESLWGRYCLRFESNIFVVVV